MILSETDVYLQPPIPHAACCKPQEAGTSNLVVPVTRSKLKKAEWLPHTEAAANEIKKTIIVNFYVVLIQMV